MGRILTVFHCGNINRHSTGTCSNCHSIHSAHICVVWMQGGKGYPHLCCNCTKFRPCFTFGHINNIMSYGSIVIFKPRSTPWEFNSCWVDRETCNILWWSRWNYRERNQALNHHYVIITFCFKVAQRNEIPGYRATQVYFMPCMVPIILDSIVCYLYWTVSLHIKVPLSCIM